LPSIWGTFTYVVWTPKASFREKCYHSPARRKGRRAIALVLEKAAGAPHQSAYITAPRLGTNAIIERRGARHALITQGLQDTLEFGIRARFDQ